MVNLGFFGLSWFLGFSKTGHCCKDSCLSLQTQQLSENRFWCPQSWFFSWVLCKGFAEKTKKPRWKPRFHLGFRGSTWYHGFVNSKTNLYNAGCFWTSEKPRKPKILVSGGGSGNKSMISWYLGPKKRSPLQPEHDIIGKSFPWYHPGVHDIIPGGRWAQKPTGGRSVEGGVSQRTRCVLAGALAPVSPAGVFYCPWASPLGKQSKGQRKRGDGREMFASAFFYKWLVEVGFGFFVPRPVVLLFLLCVLWWPLVPPFRTQATNERKRGDRSTGNKSA